MGMGFLVGLWLLAAPASGATTPGDWHRVVSLLEYLEGDYGAALATQDAAELEEQRGLADEVVKQLARFGTDGATYLPRAEALKAAITSSAPAEEVTRAARELVDAVTQEQRLTKAPRRAPDLGEAKAAFEKTCGACHGLDGRADTETARTLSPAPASFHDTERMKSLTPYKAFNTLTFGIPGTAMPGFPHLREETRWALAFHLFTLRQPACSDAPPRTTLEELATATDDHLAARFGAGEVACLRRVLPQPDDSTLLLARGLLDEALRLSSRGQHDAARQQVVDAYLEGLEPVEPLLRARDPALVAKLEAAFTRTRLAAQDGRGLEAEIRATQALLDEASHPAHSGGFWSVFFAALLILLREGFEAVVVVGALLAVLKKLGATRHARVVHLGWGSALAAGALAFASGHALVAGANREWLESVVALFAVGMLLYAALWLNTRAHLSQSMGSLRSKMSGAVAGNSALGLFVVAFTSVGRESLETALFLEGLATDSVAAVAWGAVSGLGVLGALLLVVRRVGFVLPMKTLFSASTVLLLATAVALLGKGLHGLQELGVLALAPVRFITVEVLGVYPDAVSLVPQALLATVLVSGWTWSRRTTGGRGHGERVPT
ncbi:MAG: FTR1 family protein [Myxococcota bacterium]